MSRKERIEHLLQRELNPSYLSVENESTHHHVPPGSETHFKLIIVSHHFNTLTRLARHRVVNHLLAAEFKQGLHALSMHLYTQEEWAMKQTVLKSPHCRDGYKNK